MGDGKLSEAEGYIMRMFWAHGAMKTDELSRLVAEKGWKPTTLLTFLSRLVAKGMLAAEKQGKSNLYRPLVEREAYRRDEGRAFLDELYDGSAKDFIACLVGGRGLSAAEVGELKAWLDTQEVTDNE